MTSNQPSAHTYTYSPPLSTSKITDDQHVDHAQANGYFVIGKGKPADHATLVRGETIDLVQIFSGVDADVKRVNLIIGRQYLSTDLN